MKLTEYEIDLTKVGRDMPYEQMREFDIYEFTKKLNDPVITILNDYHLSNRTGVGGFFNLLNFQIGVSDRGGSDNQGKTINHEVSHNNNYSHIPIAIENAIRQDTGTVTYKHSPENHYSSFHYN